MLLLISQFINKEAIRSPLYLFTPPVTHQDSVSMPKFSVVHYLDMKTESHFPARDLYYLRLVDDSKRIPLLHVSELTTKSEISALHNKTAVVEIKNWNRANSKQFKSVDLIESPNHDANLIAVYNYNILKDLYNYKSSNAKEYYRFNNIYDTYWSVIKTAINKDKESTHFVSIDIPNLIPNASILREMLKRKITQFMHLVKDQDLLYVADLFKWLAGDMRGDSCMRNITDEDSTRIIVELKYKGYSSFLPLSMVRSISEKSQLPSKLKLPENKLQHILIISMRKFQDSVNKIIEESLSDEEVASANNAATTPVTDTQVDDIENTDDEGEEPEVSETPLPPSMINPQNSPMEKLNNTKLEDADLPSMKDFINKELTTFDEENIETDKYFQESVSAIIKEDKIKHVDKEEGSVVEEPLFDTSYSQEEINSALSDVTLDKKFEKHIENAILFKSLTATEIRSLKKAKEVRTLIKSPYQKDVKLDDYIVKVPKEQELEPDELALPINNNLVEDDLKKEIINNFDRKYIKNTLRRDIAACVTKLEDSGCIIKDYNVQEESSVLGNYEIHRLVIKPLYTKESSILFRIPKIDKEGTYRASGIIYKMRKQRADVPIRKISPIKVALTTSYGKLFIQRSEKKVNDSYRYFADFLRNNYLEEEGLVTKIVPGGRVLNTVNLPNMYKYLSENFIEVHTTKLTLLLNYNERQNYVDEKTLKEIEQKGYTFTGYLPNKHILVFGQDDTLYDYTDGLTSLGTIESYIGLDLEKLPKSYTIIKILGDYLPLGVCLSYYLGLRQLVAVTGVKFTLLEPRKQYTATVNDVVIRFSDAKLVIHTTKKEEALLFNGFHWYKDFTKRHSIKEFSNKAIYLNMIESRDSRLIHLKELDLLQELFIDPISADVLKEMKEPAEYIPLLLRANELLKDFVHPDTNDPMYSRIRGYDRVPGLMYKALTESIRDHRFKSSNRSKIELDPYKVWNYITQDSTVKITEDINPILNVKENEAVTFSGADGLSKMATPKQIRSYHKNDIGLISEATTDSADVALNVSLTPYAKLSNTRGIVTPGTLEVDENQSKAFSTSILLSPMAEYDSPKRMNYVNIQNGHTIMSGGYKQPIIRTGYEYVMPYKVGKLYCTMAREDGIVTKRTDKIVIVKYKDGEVEGIPIGIRYGKMEGSTYPHSIVSDLKEGDKFKMGEPIAFNEYFFERDWLDPRRILMKFNRNVTVALTMNNEVYEDSSAISAELSKTMSTKSIKDKSFILEFGKNIINIIPEGTDVEPNDILFTVLDETTDYNNLSETSINMLQNLASLSPKAKIRGTVVRYEVKYNGDIADMSPTLRKLANRLDKEAFEESEGTEYEVQNNRTTSEYRSEGKNLNVDTLELKVFIQTEIEQKLGDKSVYAGQMKNVISNVFHQTITTNSGDKIDAMFSFKGMLARQVVSPIIMGTTNRLVRYASKKLAEIYFS